MINRFLDAQVPYLNASTDDGVLAGEAAQVYREFQEAMDQLLISDALTAVFRLVRRANKYIEEQKPWDLAKTGKTEALGNVLYGLWETLRIVSVLLTPFLLDTPDRIRQQLGLDTSVAHIKEAIFGYEPAGLVIRRGEALFPRIDKAGPAPSQESTSTPAPAASEDNWVDVGDFQKLEFRVGTVRKADVVKGADRLLQLTVFDGVRERTIVSGIRQHYEPDDLVGKQVVLVANLKPAKLRGIVSEGMLLAGSQGDVLSIVTPLAPLPDGARVK